MQVKIVFIILCAISATEVRGDDDDDDEDDFPEHIYMNTTVNPCEDFYEYTCGNFKNVYPLDQDTLTIDHFTLLEEKLINIVHDILLEENYEHDPEALKKSKSAYKACIDTNYLDKLPNPEKMIVDAENGFPLVQPSYIRSSVTYGFNDIGKAVSNYGIPMLFNLIAYSNLEDSTKNLIRIYPLEARSLTSSEIRPYHQPSYDEVIDQGFLELGQDNYKVRMKRNKHSEKLLPFDIFLRKMALKIRTAVQSALTDNEVIKNIKDLVNFTRGVFTKGYMGNKTVEDFSNMSLTLGQLNSWTKQQFQDTLKLDWVQFIQNIFANSGITITEETEVMNYVGFSSFLYGMLNMVRLTEDHVVKSYVMMRIFTYLAPDSDADSRRYIFDYFLSQDNSIFPRWKYCTRKIMDLVGTAGLSFAPAYEYQLRHFNVNKLNKAVTLIKYVGSAFKEILENSTWMDAYTKTQAIQKFDKMITALGHPDICSGKQDLDKFYENLRICKWDHYGNSIRIKALKNAYQISQVAKRDRTFWDKSPFEVNAYYNRANNKMIFPIAMLSPIFFGNQNSILDYARIGSIIGHEMTHGFDKAGMRYGPDGKLQSWWTNETAEAFDTRAACFVNEYNQFYQPEINSTVDGNITLNENIADNGGVRESFRAMKKMVNEKGITKGTAEYSTDQLFFIGFGTLWCNNPSITYLNKMKDNEHARSKFRVNGVVSNMEEFSEAFNCPLGSNMNPLNKCQLW